jgi:hypothetical protein
MSEDIHASALEQVRAKVRSAFADVRPPPPGLVALCPCEECCGVRNDLGTDIPSDWGEVSPDKIVANFDKLPLLTPQAFHYFLPAFMSYALGHWQSSVWEFTVYMLTPNRGRDVPEQWCRDRFCGLSTEQMQAIYAFLDLVLADTEDWHMWTCANRAKRELVRLTGQG